MSEIYLIRHGQAGTRTLYDTLSDLGREQSKRLGDSLVEQKLIFTHALCGNLQRQRETAEAVLSRYNHAGASFPAIATDVGWNEFDLDAVYREIAPVLTAKDPQFRAEYEEMQLQMVDQSHDIHRRWSRCDMLVLRAWLSGAVPVQTETFQMFQDRIAAALAGLERFGPEDRVAVFTSATPIAIATGIVLGTEMRTRIRLAGSQYNSAYTTLHRRDGEWSLFSFNNVPHLPDSTMRSLR